MSWKIVAALREILALERGAIVKDWGGKTPVALAFANTYHAGMSNLGFQAVYGLFNAESDVVCERVFLPDRGLADEYARSGSPLLSLESQRPLTEFEIIAFSLSHENDYPGLVRLLRLARIPARRQDRRESHPLIMAGGVTMRLNPEPLADFLDLVLIGDGEIIVPSLLRTWREVRSKLPLPKKERLLHLARNVPGAYAPAYYEAALDREGRLISFQPTRTDLSAVLSPARVRTLPHPALTSQILTPQTEFARTRLVEIGRGCPRGCRFCLAGFVYRPPRFQTVEAVIEALGPPGPQPERVGLVSPAVADHPQLEEIIRRLTDQGRQITVSSLRVESLTPTLAQALTAGRLKSAAVAPEAGSERLRTFINKDLTPEQIFEGVRLLAEADIRKIKLYFMIGLPTETRADVEAVVDLVKKIKDRLKRSFKGRRLLPELTLSVAGFTPKPFTPFQRMPMLETREMKLRAKILQKQLRGLQGVRVHFDVPKWAYLQTLLSRGDRRVALMLEALDRLDGNLTKAFREVPFNPDFFVTRSLDRDPLLPWSFIDHGFSPGFFDQEMDRAASGRITPPCQPETCRLCGVCPPTQDSV